MVRNDKATVAELLERRPDRLVISPGPCTPAEAGISIEASRAFPEAGVPTLGVCLGHQAMVEAFGGRTIRGEPIHGKDAEVEPRRRRHLRRPAEPAARRSLPLAGRRPRAADELERTASYGDVVMGVRHRELPAEGVQFHPESVLTPDGKTAAGQLPRASGERRCRTRSSPARSTRSPTAGT